MPTSQSAFVSSHGSLDYFIRLKQKRRGDGEAERLGGLEVDGNLELHRPLHGQASGLGPFEDLINIGGSASGQVRWAWPIRQETAGMHPLSRVVYRWQSILGREVHNPLQVK